MNTKSIENIKNFLNKDITKSKINGRVMSLFLKQLSLLISSGIALDKSLRIIENQKLDKNLSKALARVNYDLAKGLSINEAFNNNKKFFNPMLVAFIKSGENSGQMAKVLDELSTYIQKESKNKNIIKQAMTYPIILLIIMVIVVAIVINFVLPSFLSVFESYDSKLPLATRILLGTYAFFKDYSPFILAIIFALILSIFLLRKDEQARLGVDKFLFLKTPFFSYRRLGLEYQLTSLFYILKAGDVGIISSLSIIRESFKNTYIKEIITNIIALLESGHSLSASLEHEKIFSPLLISMIRIGEDSGQMKEALKKSSDYFATDYIYKLNYLSKMAEPVMIIIMSLLVAFVVLAIALPIFDSVNGLNI